MNASLEKLLTKTVQSASQLYMLKSIWKISMCVYGGGGYNTNRSNKEEKSFSVYSVLSLINIHH